MGVQRKGHGMGVMERGDGVKGRCVKDNREGWDG